MKQSFAYKGCTIHVWSQRIRAGGWTANCRVEWRHEGLDYTKSLAPVGSHAEEAQALQVAKAAGVAWVDSNG